MKKATVLLAIAAFVLLSINTINADEYKTYGVYVEKDAKVYAKPSQASALVCIIPQGAHATMIISRTQTPTDTKTDQWYYVEYAGKGGYTYGTGRMIAGGK